MFFYSLSVLHGVTDTCSFLDVPFFYSKGVFWGDVYTYIYICNSYATGKSALPDIYAQARGPQAQGRVRRYRQNVSAHGITNMFYFSM